MSAEGNKTVIRHFYEEVWSQGNLEDFSDYVDPNLTDHNPLAFPGRAPGAEGLKQVVAMIRGAFPDLHRTIEDQVAEGDRVMTRFSDRATHMGDFMGVSPTGKSVVVTGINIERIAGGKIVELWHIEDLLGLLQQLGVIPSPGQGN